MFQLRFHLQQEPSGSGSLRADVRMGKRIQYRAVHVGHEHLQKPLGLGVVHAVHERLQKFVQLPHIHRIIGHAGHMLVKDQQAVQRFQKIRGRRKLQKTAAFLHEFRIVRDNVPRTHRGMSLRQVTDALCLYIRIQKFIKPLRQIQDFHQGIRLVGQIGQLLLMCQRRALDDLKDLLPRRVHPFHGNVSHYLLTPPSRFTH